jgi:hypothetical protein
VRAIVIFQNVFVIISGHRSPSGSRNKAFILCLFYAWGLPLTITGLTLIVNHTGAMDVAYGKRMQNHSAPARAADGGEQKVISDSFLHT